MSLINIETYEHLIDGIVVSHKAIKFCGIPLYVSHIESSNYNWVGQFDADNFRNDKQEESKPTPIYTETNIGFNHDKDEKTTIQPEGIFRKS